MQKIVYELKYCRTSNLKENKHANEVATATGLVT
jgi:hypothetical protein